MEFSDLLYIFPVCLVSLAIIAVFWLMISFLLFRSVDQQLRRCPHCKRGAAGTIIDTESELLQNTIDHSKLTPMRFKKEKVTDHYQCDYCGHVWQRSFERRENSPVRGVPPA